MLDGQNMTISKATRTHLIYQFIILTLLLLGIGYNELLTDLKFLISLAFLPILGYQILILFCSMDLMPVPSWMGFLCNEKCKTEADNFGKDFESSVACTSSLTDAKRIASFPEVNEIPPSYSRRWEKSVTNLGATPKYFDCPQKSKSWMNLSDSKSTERLSQEDLGSLEALVALSEKKSNTRVEKRKDKTRKRGERAAKAKSWKSDILDFDVSQSEFTHYKDPPVEKTIELPPLRCEEAEEESELAKSYSFPIRQKRLETWLEMKETNTTEVNKSPGMPYWQTVGYNLAVKYEARRRRRAISTPTRTESFDQLQSFQKPPGIVLESSPIDKANASFKKSAKTATACMNKIKSGFSNLISKKKEESSESSGVNQNKIIKSVFKMKNKSTSAETKDKPTAMPEFPQFLNNDRPLIFYPKYIPFEKERFESDVKKKMIELAEEPKGHLQRIK